MAKTKKPEKKPKAKARSASTLRSVAELERTIAAQAREIREGAEQQAATSEILRMIAKAPGDLQSVLDALAECAARLCDAKDAQIFRLNDNASDVSLRTVTFRLRSNIRPITVSRPRAERWSIGKLFMSPTLRPWWIASFR